MEYYIAVFWSRTEALSFSNVLKRNNIPSEMIRTPKEAGRTCGISVKIMPEYFSQAKFLLARTGNSSFGGWFQEVIQNGRKVIFKK